MTVKIDEVTDREIASDLITDTETQCLEWHWSSGYMTLATVTTTVSPVTFRQCHMTCASYWSPTQQHALNISSNGTLIVC